MNLEKDIDFILSHFDNYNLFPRKMMTAKSNGQFTVYSRNEILERCIESDFIDCRINAYPEYIKWEKYDLIRQTPNFIFIDLDLSNFLKYKDPKKILDSVLKNTLKNIQGMGYEPSQRSRHSPSSYQQQHNDIKQVQPTVLWKVTDTMFIFQYKQLFWIHMSNFLKINFQIYFQYLVANITGIQYQKFF